MTAPFSFFHFTPGYLVLFFSFLSLSFQGPRTLSTTLIASFFSFSFAAVRSFVHIAFKCCNSVNTPAPFGDKGERFEGEDF